MANLTDPNGNLVAKGHMNLSLKKFVSIKIDPAQTEQVLKKAETILNKLLSDSKKNDGIYQGPDIHEFVNAFEQQGLLLRDPTLVSILFVQLQQEFLVKETLELVKDRLESKGVYLDSGADGVDVIRFFYEHELV